MSVKNGSVAMAFPLASVDTLARDAQSNTSGTPIAT
jgi:hypothetical protein